MFERERRRFARVYPECDQATLAVKRYRRVSDRSCARCHTGKMEVQFHPVALEGLDRHQCLALVRHELAHCCEPELNEADTDALAEFVSGEPIYYGWDDDIQTTRGGMRPRPDYLPEW